MTNSSYHLAGWRNTNYWSSSHTVRHWLAGNGYDGLWKDPTLNLYRLNLYANRVVC